LKICPNCKSEITEISSRFCNNCGFEFKENNMSQQNTEDNDKLDFVVTEASPDNHEFVGGQKKFPDESDNLGIESNSDLMEKEAQSQTDPDILNPNLTSENNDLSPIGDTAPPLPPESEYPVNNEQTASQPEESQMSPNGIKKLSPDEVKDIEKKLYGENSAYLNDKEKTELINKLDNINEPFGNAPIEPPKKKQSDPVKPVEEIKSDFEPPSMAKKGKGVAYYYRNFIQVMGSHEIMPDEELILGQRTYELKQRKFNTKIGIAASVVLFAIILFAIGSQFIADVGDGQGQIIGIVLDENNQPFIQGATIHLPDLNKKAKTNPQGFFRLSPVPEGTHRLEYIVEGNILKIDYATISDNKATFLTLKPDETDLTANEPVQSSAKTKTVPVVRAETPPPSEVSKKPPEKTITTPKKTASTSSKTTKKSSYSKITLKANVEGAKFNLDGSTLGAGNLTFSKIKPGKHKFTVSKEGYEPYSGTISLKNGEKKTLKVDLLPMDQGQKAETYNEKDFYYSAYNLYKENKYENAITDFTKAVELKPSYAQAYFYRGEAYSKLKENAKAHDDFVRSAEIYQFQKNYNLAITAYNRAIEMDGKSIAAHLGRGNTYLIKGEPRAAINDFDSVKKYDKHNARAYFGLGEARFKQGNYKKAVKHFKDAKSLEPKNPLIYQYLMLSYFARDDMKNVKKSFKKFKEVASENQYNQLMDDNNFAAVREVINLDLE